jgi:hypothetical protein
MKPIPNIGETYPLFDDGKLNDTRLYYGEVRRILTVEDAKKETVGHLEKIGDDYGLVERYLYDVWVQETKDAEFLFSQETDYFVELSAPEYDENLLWAVRTKDGGWFTMDIQSDWQGCEVDTDGSLLEEMNRRYEEYSGEN